MRLTKIQFNNFRCWDNFKIEKLAKYNVIIGENNLGKSSIFEAILKPIEEFHPHNKPEKINLPNKIFEYVKRNQISCLIQIWANPVDNRLKILLESQYRKFSPNQPNILKFLINFKSDWDNVNLNFTTSLDLKLNKGRTSLQYKILNNSINNFKTHLTTSFKASSFYSGISNILFSNFDYVYIIQEQINKSIKYIPSRRYVRIENTQELYNPSIRAFGDKIKKQLFNMRNSAEIEDNNRYEKFKTIIKNLSFSPGIPEIIAESSKPIELIFRNSKDEAIQIEELGDGVKDFIIIIAICLINPNFVILIEEPELHLHPRAIRELRYILKYEIENQVIISTHNPSFIGKIDEDTSVIKVIEKSNSPVAIQINSKNELLEFRNEFGLQNSDFLFEDNLVFVEGPSDVTTFSHWFELIHPNDISVRFINCGGKDEIPKYILLSFLIQIQQNFQLIIIEDKDNDTHESRKEEILNGLKKHNPHISDEDLSKIERSIFVLNKKTLESYYLLPSVLSKWLGVPESDIVSELQKIRGNNPVKKLKVLANKYGKNFKKNNSKELLACFIEEDIDSEIKELFQNIISELSNYVDEVN